MKQAALWRQIRDALGDDIAAGRYPPGSRLPTEAELSRRFDVNRHTARRALGDLRDAGIVHARRGSGVYVTEARIEYRIGARTRMSANLAGSGHEGARRILRLETLPAEPAEAEVLGLAPGDAVHLYEGVTMGDGVPFALARSAFPAARLPGFPARLAASGSVTEALAGCGVRDYRRLWTRLTAQVADAVSARHLRLAPGAALLRAVALNVDPEGVAVEYGRTWFASDRVEIVVDPAGFGADPS